MSAFYLYFKIKEVISWKPYARGFQFEMYASQARFPLPELTARVNGPS